MAGPTDHARVASAVCGEQPEPQSASEAGGNVVHRRERRRKLAHALPGLIPFAMLTLYHEDPLPPWNLAVVIGVVSVLTLFFYRRRAAISRPGEHWGITCVTYSIAPILMLCLFPQRAEYAGVVLIVVAFGDSSAGLGGSTFGRRRLPWNRRKTWLGTASFLSVAAPLAILLYWAEAQPRVDLVEPAVCATMAALCGAVAESLPLRSIDNLRIGLAAATGLVLSHALFF